MSTFFASAQLEIDEPVEIQDFLNLRRQISKITPHGVYRVGTLPFDARRAKCIFHKKQLTICSDDDRFCRHR